MRDATQITPDTAFIYRIKFVSASNEQRELYLAAASQDAALKKLEEQHGNVIVLECEDRTHAA